MSEFHDAKQEAFRKGGWPKTDKSFQTCFSHGFDQGTKYVLDQVAQFIQTEKEIVDNPKAAWARLAEFLTRVTR